MRVSTLRGLSLAAAILFFGLFLLGLRAQSTGEYTTILRVLLINGAPFIALFFLLLSSWDTRFAGPLGGLVMLATIFGLLFVLVVMTFLEYEASSFLYLLIPLGVFGIGWFLSRSNLHK